MSSPAFCTKCGSRISPGNHFCTSCGAPAGGGSGGVQQQVSVMQPMADQLFSQNEYIIDQKLVAVRDTYGVKTRQGELLAYVKKKIVSIGAQFWFEDGSGRHLGEVHAKLIAVRPTYEIYSEGGEMKGVVKKKILKLFGSEWWLEAPPGRETARIDGNIVEHDYRILDPAKRPIAQIHKKWVSIRDSYCVEIYGQSIERLLVLGLVVAMDTVEHK